ncbi:MAG: AAA family ATPase [Bacteroidetes bacterium]|nr:AAA family ATPase [Bacteroidota bacterium]
MKKFPRISSITISGYRPFGEFHANLGSLEVIVGANGSGKSSLLEFMQVLRNAVSGNELIPGLVPGGAARALYHRGASHGDQIACEVTVDDLMKESLLYNLHVGGQFGNRVLFEEVAAWHDGEAELLLHRDDMGTGLRVAENYQGAAGMLLGDGPSQGSSFDPDRLALGWWGRGRMTSSLDVLQQHLRDGRFYGTYEIATEKLRQPVITEQNPVLEEDASNLSDVLLHLSNEHRKAFEEINAVMRLLVPGFDRLKVKSYGAPGHVMAFWNEDGVDQDLSLADLSAGIFRLLCWVVLCLDPDPPALICIDEPDQGVHPRTLPVLAGLFKEASERTQIILTTHNSYFLSRFALEDIAVMRKERGEAEFIKPKDSKALVAILQDFGSQEIEALHRSEELEQLP